MSGRYHLAENSLLTKHVVAAGKFVRDAGSIPAASTILLVADGRAKLKASSTLSLKRGLPLQANASPAK